MSQTPTMSPRFDAGQTQGAGKRLRVAENLMKLATGDQSHPRPSTKPGAKKSFRAPQFIVCYLCGQQFGSASIGIHQPQCYVKKLIQWERGDPATRGARPQHPDEYHAEMAARGVALAAADAAPAASGAGTKSSLERFNDAQFEQFATKALVACEHCNRTFLPDRLVIHLRSCKGGGVGSKPIRRSQEAPAKPPARVPVKERMTLSQQRSQNAERARSLSPAAGARAPAPNAATTQLQRAGSSSPAGLKSARPGMPRQQHADPLANFEVADPRAAFAAPAETKAAAPQPEAHPAGEAIEVAPDTIELEDAADDLPSSPPAMLGTVRPGHGSGGVHDALAALLDGHDDGHESGHGGVEDEVSPYAAPRLRTECPTEDDRSSMPSAHSTVRGADHIVDSATTSPSAAPLDRTVRPATVSPDASTDIVTEHDEAGEGDSYDYGPGPESAEPEPVAVQQSPPAGRTSSRVSQPRPVQLSACQRAMAEKRAAEAAAMRAQRGSKSPQRPSTAGTASRVGAASGGPVMDRLAARSDAATTSRTRCRHCQRGFDAGRLAKHEEVCVERDRIRVGSGGKAPLAASARPSTATGARPTTPRAGSGRLSGGTTRPAPKAAPAAGAPRPKFCFECGCAVPRPEARFCGDCGTAL